MSSAAFRSFRITTISALVLLGLTLISALLTDLSMGFTGYAVMLALIYASLAIHPYLSMKLQARIKMPPLPATDGLSIMLIITGILNMAYGLYMIYIFLGLTVLSGGGLVKLLLSKKMIGPTTVLLSITGVMATISGVTVAVNSVLSFYFLRKWKLKNSINENTE